MRFVFNGKVESDGVGSLEYDADAFLGEQRTIFPPRTETLMSSSQASEQPWTCGYDVDGVTQRLICYRSTSRDLVEYKGTGDPSTWTRRTINIANTSESSDTVDLLTQASDLATGSVDDEDGTSVDLDTITMQPVTARYVNGLVVFMCRCAAWSGSAWETVRWCIITLQQDEWEDVIAGNTTAFGSQRVVPFLSDDNNAEYNEDAGGNIGRSMVLQVNPLDDGDKLNLFIACCDYRGGVGSRHTGGDLVVAKYTRTGISSQAWAYDSHELLYSRDGFTGGNFHTHCALAIRYGESGVAVFSGHGDGRGNAGAVMYTRDDESLSSAGWTLTVVDGEFPTAPSPTAAQTHDHGRQPIGSLRVSKALTGMDMVVCADETSKAITSITIPDDFVPGTTQLDYKPLFQGGSAFNPDVNWNAFPITALASDPTVTAMTITVRAGTDSAPAPPSSINRTLISVDGGQTWGIIGVTDAWVAPSACGRYIFTVNARVDAGVHVSLVPSPVTLNPIMTSPLVTNLATEDRTITNTLADGWTMVEVDKDVGNANVPQNALDTLPVSREQKIVYCRYDETGSSPSNRSRPGGMELIESGTIASGSDMYVKLWVYPIGPEEGGAASTFSMGAGLYNNTGVFKGQAYFAAGKNITQQAGWQPFTILIPVSGGITNDVVVLPIDTQNSSAPRPADNTRWLICIDAAMFGENAIPRRNTPRGQSSSPLKATGLKATASWSVLALLQIPEDGWDGATFDETLASRHQVPENGFPLLSLDGDGDSLHLYYRNERPNNATDTAAIAGNVFNVLTHNGSAYTSRISNFVPNSRTHIPMVEGVMAIGMSYDADTNTLRLSMSIDGDPVDSTSATVDLDAIAPNSLEMAGDPNQSRAWHRIIYTWVHAFEKMDSALDESELEAALSSLSFASEGFASGRVLRSQPRTKQLAYRPARRV